MPVHLFRASTAVETRTLSCWARTATVGRPVKAHPSPVHQTGIAGTTESRADTPNPPNNTDSLCG